MGVQHVAGAVHEVVGVERVAGDVEGRALVGQGLPDHGVVRALRQVAHRTASRSAVSAQSLRSALPSMAER